MHRHWSFIAMKLSLLCVNPPDDRCPLEDYDTVLKKCVSPNNAIFVKL